jgi:cell division control protein 7
MTNVPTVDAPPRSLEYLILKLNPHLYTPSMTHPTPEEASAHIEAMDEAILLCVQLLRLDATKRITAAHALNHRFFRGGEGWKEEDEHVGVHSEMGKCGNLHEVNPPRRE